MDTSEIRLMQKFKRLSQVGQREALSTAALAAAKPISNQWKQNIGDWPLILTGTYRRSIHEEVFQESTQPGQVLVLIGTDIVDPPYPAFLEWGTSKMAPKPVGRNAYESQKDEAQKEFGEVIQQLINQAIA